MNKFFTTAFCNVCVCLQSLKWRVNFVSQSVATMMTIFILCYHNITILLLSTINLYVKFVNYKFNNAGNFLLRLFFSISLTQSHTRRKLRGQEIKPFFSAFKYTKFKREKLFNGLFCRCNHILSIHTNTFSLVVKFFGPFFPSLNMRTFINIFFGAFARLKCVKSILFS